MDIDRRRLVVLSALGGAVPVAGLATPAAAAPMSTIGVDAATLGVRAGGGAEQTNMLQAAIDRTASAGVPLILGPGDYRVGSIRLPKGAQIFGVRGSTRLIATGNGPVFSGRGCDNLTLASLTIDGAVRPMAEGAGLIDIVQSKSVRIVDCEIRRSSRNGIVLEGVDGTLAGNSIVGATDAAIFSRDAQGLTIQSNTIRGAANNGILVWRTAKGDDGTLVIDNRIEEVAATRGGSGQNGNAVNVFRADNVIVRGNRISRVAFSGVRGNAASNLQITGNTIGEAGEVAIYSEFGFEGVVIANNTVDGAALGISVTNFNEGGRLAVVQGNLIRNLKNKRPEGTDPNDVAGVGIAVEADASVNGNVIENAPTAGINLGWGKYLRDVSVVGNVVRAAGYGVTVSVAQGAGTAVIAGNLIAAASRGAIVGMDFAKAVTGDLVKEPTRFAQLQISGNRVR